MELTKYSIQKISNGGRARWKIENEVFNTLKNQGYQCEHNFGHGTKNLNSVLVNLMFIAFTIDQILQLCCHYFTSALTKCGSKLRLWRKMGVLFFGYFIDSWEHLYLAITNGLGAKLSPLVNTT